MEIRGMLDRSLVSRLTGQLDSFLALSGGQERLELLEHLEQGPESGKWSAHENLAHLTRHHQVMLARLERIRREDRPRLDRYRAEEDPEWPALCRVSPSENLATLRKLRSELFAAVQSLSPAEIARTGVHPTFGEMSVAAWLEFFLLHEAHHLYLVFVLVGGARRK
jgi:hypothetical protein